MKRFSFLFALFALVNVAVAADAVSPASTQLAEFRDWPAGASPTEIGHRVSDRFLQTPFSDEGKPHHFIIYPEVCTWYGALTFAQLAGDKTLTGKLVDRFAPLLQPENEWRIPPINHVDASVFGVVPLEIYRQIRRAPYRQLGLTMADGQWDNPQPDGLTNQTRYWIDDMFMITALQVEAYRVTDDPRYIERASREMVAYLKKLQQPNGLFYHAPEVPFYWGRGNGWVAVGMAEVLRSLPKDHPDRPVILAAFQKMMATLLANQTSDGLWRQLIDKPESWIETSASGMFTYAFITGVKEGWLDEKTYGPAARKAWLQLITYLNDRGEIREVCIGTGKKNDYQYYIDRPRAVGDLHGQATVLWCATALLR
jgi:rhamnogalacturonyl hydrolase YesR